MQKPHDVILAEADWLVEFLREQRQAAADRGEDMTQWQAVPEGVAELRDYADRLLQRG